jgi:hypothetical protein
VFLRIVETHLFPRERKRERWRTTAEALDLEDLGTGGAVDERHIDDVKGRNEGVLAAVVHSTIDTVLSQKPYIYHRVDSDTTDLQTWRLANTQTAVLLFRNVPFVTPTRKGCSPICCAH